VALFFFLLHFFPFFFWIHRAIQRNIQFSAYCPPCHAIYKPSCRDHWYHLVSQASPSDSQSCIATTRREGLETLCTIFSVFRFLNKNWHQVSEPCCLLFKPGHIICMACVNPSLHGGSGMWLGLWSGDLWLYWLCTEEQCHPQGTVALEQLVAGTTCKGTAINHTGFCKIFATGIPPRSFDNCTTVVPGLLFWLLLSFSKILQLEESEKRYYACPVLWCGLCTWSLSLFLVARSWKPTVLPTNKERSWLFTVLLQRFCKTL
jgi:hypothetical protein